jgi:hypothetical protein
MKSNNLETLKLVRNEVETFQDLVYPLGLGGEISHLEIPDPGRTILTTRVHPPTILLQLGRSLLGMHQISGRPDIRPAGYPANQKAGSRISGTVRVGYLA